jgi:hypothetical protein
VTRVTTTPTLTSEPTVSKTPFVPSTYLPPTSSNKTTPSIITLTSKPTTTTILPSTYLPPETTTPIITPVIDITTTPLTPISPRISTRGSSYLPIETKPTPPRTRTSFIPRPFTPGIRPSYYYNWTFGSGSYRNTRNYTYQSTTTTPRYQEKDFTNFNAGRK